MHILIDTQTGEIIGFANSAEYPAGTGQALIQAPPEFVSGEAAEWSLVDGALIHDLAIALSRKKAERIAQIKREAAEHIAASDWRLERAREREAAGWATLAAVDAVLAEREAVRRSSDAAEAAVAACTTLAELAALTWQADDVPVPAPRLMTHEALIKLFSADEWEAMAAAARQSAAMDAWMRRFSLASVVNFDDEATVMGIQMLEMAGILAAGRAAEILASVP